MVHLCGATVTIRPVSGLGDPRRSVLWRPPSGILSPFCDEVIHSDASVRTTISKQSIELWIKEKFSKEKKTNEELNVWQLEIPTDELRRQYEQLDSMIWEEKVSLGAFAVLAVLWVFRADLDLGSFVIPGWLSF